MSQGASTRQSGFAACWVAECHESVFRLESALYQGVCVMLDVLSFELVTEEFNTEPSDSVACDGLSCQELSYHDGYQ